MESVLITGGSGLVGRHLSRKLTDKGYKVAFLSRSPGRNSGIPSYFWLQPVVRLIKMLSPELII